MNMWNKLEETEEILGTEATLEAIAYARGDWALQEDIEYIAQCHGYSLDEDESTWDQYLELAEYFCDSQDFLDNLVKAIGINELNPLLDDIWQDHGLQATS